MHYFSINQEIPQSLFCFRFANRHKGRNFATPFEPIVRHDFQQTTHRVFIRFGCNRTDAARRFMLVDQARA